MAKKLKVEKVAHAVKVIKKPLLFLCTGIIIFLSFANFALWVKNEIVKTKIAPIKNEISFWKSLVEKTPTYRDGYLKLATLYWQLNEDEKVKENLKAAKTIDPNYQETYELEKRLGH